MGMYLIEAGTKCHIGKRGHFGALDYVQPFVTRRTNVFWKEELLGTMPVDGKPMMVFKYFPRNVEESKCSNWVLFVSEEAAQYG